MTDRISSTWRGRPAPLRPSWRLPAVSRRWRTAAVLAAPVAVFGASSWFLADFLAALFATFLVTVVVGVPWVGLRLERRVDAVEDSQDEVGRRVTRDALRWRELDAATADVARLSSRVRFLEEMRLGEPQEKQGDGRSRG